MGKGVRVKGGGKSGRGNVKDGGRGKVKHGVTVGRISYLDMIYRINAVANEKEVVLKFFDLGILKYKL